MATFCNQKILSFIMHISSSTNTTTTDVPWQLASLLLPQCDAKRWEVGSRGKACMKSDNMKICQHSWKAFRQHQSTELPAGLKKACSASQLSPPGSCISITQGGRGLIGPGRFSPSSQELCRAAEQVGNFWWCYSLIGWGNALHILLSFLPAFRKKVILVPPALPLTRVSRVLHVHGHPSPAVTTVLVFMACKMYGLKGHEKMS